MYPYINNYMPKQEVIRVTGMNGANAYAMPPNSSTLVLDENEPLVYLLMTDGAGYKTVTPYTITPYKPEPPVDMKALLERIERLERRYESDTATVNTKKQQSQSAYAAKTNA